MIQAIAIDDEKPALNIIENFCIRSERVQLLKTFTQPSEGLKYIEQYPIELIFLDINMPSVTGIELHKYIPQHILVIFSTAYSEYAVEGFNLNAVDYLLKPYTYTRFTQAIEKAGDYIKILRQKPDTGLQYLLIRSNYSLVKINFEDIVYIEALDDYVKIFTINNPPVLTRITFKALMQKLPENKFVRIHRSYIIAINKIKSVRNKQVFFDTATLPVSASYEEDFLNRFNK